MPDPERLMLPKADFRALFGRMIDVPKAALIEAEQRGRKSKRRKKPAA